MLSITISLKDSFGDSLGSEDGKALHDVLTDMRFDDITLDFTDITHISNPFISSAFLGMEVSDPNFLRRISFVNLSALEGKFIYGALFGIM